MAQLLTYLPMASIDHLVFRFPALLKLDELMMVFNAFASFSWGILHFTEWFCFPLIFGTSSPSLLFLSDTQVVYGNEFLWRILGKRQIPSNTTCAWSLFFTRKTRTTIIKDHTSFTSRAIWLEQLAHFSFEVVHYGVPGPATSLDCSSASQLFWWIGCVGSANRKFRRGRALEISFFNANQTKK